MVCLFVCFFLLWLIKFEFFLQFRLKMYDFMCAETPSTHMNLRKHSRSKEVHLCTGAWAWLSPLSWQQLPSQMVDAKLYKELQTMCVRVQLEERCPTYNPCFQYLRGHYTGLRSFPAAIICQTLTWVFTLKLRFDVMEANIKGPCKAVRWVCGDIYHINTNDGNKHQKACCFSASVPHSL